jgi:hypothetical protein
MQATPSNTAQNPYQQSQQDTQEENPSQNREQANHSNLNASVKNNSTQGGDNDGLASDKTPAKKPVMVSKPVKTTLDVSTSEVENNRKPPAPISPRGPKPIPRLQLPVTGQNPKSPRSPRSDQSRNIAESVPKSPGRDEIIKMADSEAYAYRGFGSPRKEQPIPRRLESRRDLDKSLTERAQEKTDNFHKSTTSTTSTTATAQASITTTETTTTTTTTTDTQPATTMNSFERGAISTGLAAESHSDFFNTVTQIDNPAVLNFTHQTGGSGALPDEPGYQQSHFFIKARRKVSMPKVFVPASDSVMTSPAQSARDVKYSKQAQIVLLADMLVNECAGDSINPNDMGSISQNNAALNLNKLPVEFSEFNSYLKGKNKPNLTHFIHAIFRPNFESSDVWKKAIAIDHKFSRGGYTWTPRSGSFEGDFENQLKILLQGYADEFSAHLFGILPSVKSIGITEELKTFLFMADKKFVEKLVDQDSRASAGEKGVDRLSKKNIEQLRAYFLMNILVTRLIKPMLITDNRSNTHVSMALLQMEIHSVNKAALELCKDFQQKSFELFPDSLQKIIIRKSEDELKIATIQKGKDRFLQIKEGYSQRHTRSRSDLGVGIKANPLEDRARLEYQKKTQRKQLENQSKQINDQLGQVLAEMEINEFPSSLAKEIDLVKMTWFSIDDEVSNHAVVQSLLKTTRNLITATKMDKDLMAFEEKIRSLASESLDSRAKRRATMPLSLGDLDFLNAILDQTINYDLSSESNSSNLTPASILSTADDSENTITTTTTASTRTTTTTIFNPAVVTLQNSFPFTMESNSSGSQHNDPSKSTN